MARLWRYGLLFVLAVVLTGPARPAAPSLLAISPDASVIDLPEELSQLFGRCAFFDLETEDNNERTDKEPAGEELTWLTQPPQMAMAAGAAPARERAEIVPVYLAWRARTRQARAPPLA